MNAVGGRHGLSPALVSRSIKSGRLIRGTVHGELFLQESGTHQYTAVVREDARVLNLGRNDVFDALLEYPEFGVAMVQDLALRHHTLTERVIELEKQVASPRARVAERTGGEAIERPELGMDPAYDSIEKRRDAWGEADTALATYNANPTNLQRDAIVNAAFRTGYFSIWMKVFEAVPLIRLAMIDRAEQFLRQQGLSNLRVRYHQGDLARVEVPQEELLRLCDPALRR